MIEFFEDADQRDEQSSEKAVTFRPVRYRFGKREVREAHDGLPTLAMRDFFHFLVVFLLPVSSIADKSTQTKVLTVECDAVSESGNPMAGADIFVSHSNGRERWLDDPIFSTGKTDEQGRFYGKFSMPAFWEYFNASVIVFADESAGIGHLFYTSSEETHLSTKVVVLPTTVFKAKLVQPDGEPAAGVEVWIDSFSLPNRDTSSRHRMYGRLSKLPGEVWNAKTTADGTFVIPRVLKDMSVYFAHADHRYAQLKDKHRILMPTMPRADGTEHTLSLTTPGSIRGRAVLADGTPAGGSIVSIIERTPYVTAFGGEIKAGPDGRFEFGQIPASTYHLHYRSQPPFYDEWIGGEREGVIVEEGKPSDVADLTMSEVAVVTAKVVNAATGAHVEDPIVFRLGPGDHELSYRSRRYPPRGFHPPNDRERISVSLGAGEKKTVEFKLHPVKPEELVIGIVKCANGQPAESATVALMIENEWDTPPPVKVEGDGTFSVVARSDLQGLSLIAWDGDGAMSYPVPVKRGTAAEVWLKTEGFGSVEGRVVDERGEPLQDVSVECAIEGIGFGPYDGPAPLNVTSDSDGRFVFPRLWIVSEPARIHAQLKGYIADGRSNVQLVRDNATKVELTLTKPSEGISIAGVVVDSENQPVSGADIFLSGDSVIADSRHTVTDAQGRFSSGPLREGQVYLRVRQVTDLFTTETRRLVKAPAGDLRLQLPRAEGTVSGVILDGNGRPVPYAEVDSGFDFGRKTNADRQGRFVLTGLMEGWFSADVAYIGEDGIEVRNRHRLKTGVTDMELRMQPGEEPIGQPRERPQLVGKPAADLKIAIWINTSPLPGKAGGKIRILDFWGIECAPCIAALPRVRDFFKEHVGKNLEVIAVSSFYPEAEVREFLAKHPDYTFPFALQTDDSTADLDYDIRGIPLYVVIDQAGKIASHGHDWEEAKATALKLLTEM